MCTEHSLTLICAPAWKGGWGGRGALAAVALVISLIAAGCSERDTAQAALPTPEVTVASPTAAEVIEYESFTGRTVPVEQVELRARVTGYLTTVQFQPGSDVKKGDPLMNIDPRPYQADLDRTDAEIKQAEARLERLNSEYQRAQKLRTRGALSQEDLDKALGDRAEATAALAAAQAKLSGEKLNLEWCAITAPLSGRIGDRVVDVGNLVTVVKGGEGFNTPLTTIVAVDPMNVSFDLDENTLERLQQAVRDGHIKAADGDIPVEMGLPIHKGSYPLKGAINFINNQVDPKTGTIKVKAQFANPKPENGPRVLTPGMFVRLRVPVGEARKALLVPESALGTDQGRKFLYTVSDKDTALRLEATVGPTQGSLRVIEQVQGPEDPAPRSLRADERVIVKGIQRVRTGAKVDAKSAA
jgi:RND family efflux transporter MFP subunit